MFTLCENTRIQGDSAKSLAVAGLGVRSPSVFSSAQPAKIAESRVPAFSEVIGRDRYGVFPLRGKILNAAAPVNNAHKVHETLQQ